MCELVKELKLLADAVVKKEHHTLDREFSLEDKIDFVNAVQTLQTHSEYLVKELVA